jgi:hypothetical protein
MGGELMKWQGKKKTPTNDNDRRLDAWSWTESYETAEILVSR